MDSSNSSAWRTITVAHTDIDLITAALSQSSGNSLWSVVSECVLFGMWLAL